MTRVPPALDLPDLNVRRRDEKTLYLYNRTSKGFLARVRGGRSLLLWDSFCGTRGGAVTSQFGQRNSGRGTSGVLRAPRSGVRALGGPGWPLGGRPSAGGTGVPLFGSGRRSATVLCAGAMLIFSVSFQF